jgi:ComF family protein
VGICQSSHAYKTTIDYNLRTPLSRLFSAAPALRQLTPQDCQLCGAGAHASLCAACTADLPHRVEIGCVRCGAAGIVAQECGECLKNMPHFDATRTAFHYEFPLDRLVQSFKFSANLSLVTLFADAFVTQLRQHDEPLPALIVPMPLAAARLATRGFSQSQLLAAAIGKRLHIKVEANGLLRVRDTPPQAGLDRVERHKNVKGAFDCTTPLDGLTIALVDDVMTTGATMSEAAKALKKGGAARVEAWTLARTTRLH